MGETWTWTADERREIEVGWRAAKAERVEANPQLTWREVVAMRVDVAGVPWPVVAAWDRHDSAMGRIGSA
ncbi:MAG TPA: hypothetical protein VFB06_23685 [Streptosporangiaceae bacterium]|nr:hypothetical protein [Streptosporangiaceae bacterium]